MEKYRNILLILTLMCVYSCNTRHDVIFSETFIKNISEEDPNGPSRFFNTLLFCKCQDNEIQTLNVYELREIHLAEFNNISYHTFLTDLLNQRLEIKCKSQNDKFKIDENVKGTYKKGNINDFLNLYCSKKGDSLFWLKTNIPEEQRNSVFYFLFINNYLTSIDDYSGAFVIREIE